MTRGEAGRHRLSVPARGAVELGRLRKYAGFGDGWAFPEEAGIWTQGRRSELALALEGGGNGDRVLALSLGSICAAPDSSVSVVAFVNGERVADRTFNWGDPSWHIELPRSAAANGEVDLIFEIDNPRTPIEAGWSLDDERPLGLLLRGIKVLSADDAEARAGLERQRRVRAWAARRHGDLLHVRPGQTVELTDPSQYAGVKDGWTLYPDQAGVWTDGLRSDLALSLDEIRERDYVIALALESICVHPDDSLAVEALVNGERVAARDVAQGDQEWRIELPTPVPEDGAVDLTLAVAEPRSPRELGWSGDERPLGILVRSLTLEEIDRSVPLGEEIEFSEGSGAERLLGDGWSPLEPTGVWTDGEKASIVLELEGAPSGDVELLLAVDPFVTPGHRELRVDVSAGGERLGTRIFRSRRRFFRFGKRYEPLRVVLPAAVRDARGRVVIELIIHQPARPLDLGLSEDSRQLGLHLRSLVASRI